MNKLRNMSGWLLFALVAWLGLGGIAGRALADDPIRREVIDLKYNVGRNLVDQAIDRYREDPDHARKAIAAADALAREKPETLSYTSSYILATVARKLHDPDAASRLYRVAMQRAAEVESNHQYAIAAFTLLRMLVEEKRLDEAEKAAREILSTRLDDEALDDIVVEGDAELLEQIRVLAKHRDAARRLIALAVKAIDRDPATVNYTAVYLFAAVSRRIPGEVDTGKTLLRACVREAVRVRSDRKLAVFFMDLIDLLYDNEKYDEAEKVCKEFLELRVPGQSIRSGKIVALLRMVQIVALQGKTDEAFRILQPFLKNAPDNPEVVRIHGWLLRQTERYEEAIEEYEKLLKLVNRPATKDSVRYMLSHLYTEVGDIDKAGELLLELLKKDPDNATYNNDLGYIWADHDMNLDQAQKFIEKALKKEPDNPSFLDSMAWVLYKKKQYAKAKEYMVRAIQQPDSEHAELYDHLGDIHWALGEKSDAISAWKKALDLVGTSKRDLRRKAELEKKLKERQ